MKDCFTQHAKLFPKEEMAELLAKVRAAGNTDRAKVEVVHEALIKAHADLQEVTDAILKVVQPKAPELRNNEVELARIAAAERKSEREAKAVEKAAAEARAAEEAKTAEVETIQARARKRMLKADPAILEAKPAVEDWLTAEEKRRIEKLQTGESSMSEKEIARRASLSRQAQDRRSVDLNHDTIMQAAIKLGGLSLRNKNQLLKDVRNPSVPFVGFLFNKNGKGQDELASALHEYGYLTDDEVADKDGVPTMVEELEAEARGAEPRMSDRRDHDAMAEEAERRADIAEQEAAAMSPEQGAEAAGDAPPDWHTMSTEEQDAQLDPLFGSHSEEAAGLADEGARAAAGEVGQREPGQDDELANRAARDAGIQGRANAQESSGEPATERPALDLQQQTREDLAAKAARAADEKSADRERIKRESEVGAGSFSLQPEEKPQAVREAEDKAKTGDIFDASTGIDDFGEKIGGARKDVAQPLGERGQKEAEESAEPGWKKRFRVYQIAASMREAEIGKWAIQDTRVKGWKGAIVGRETFATQEAAEAALPLIAVAQKHRVVTGKSKDGATTYTIWRDVTDRKRVQVVPEDFPTREAALQHMADHAAEIIEKKTSYGEEILAKPDKVKRAGPTRREGDATAKMFTDTFGFRGVEFGLWNNQDERQEVMNHAYDGLLDLADVLNVPPKALSLNGDLALAFGARGQGLSGAKAHYEMDYGVINLTKMSGAGSLAHEWFHAFDHYMARQDTKAGAQKVKNDRGDMVYPDTTTRLGFASHGFRTVGSKVREAVRKAYDALMQTMYTKAEQYVEDTQKAEKFVGATRNALAAELKELRDDLLRGPEQLTYMKRNNKPASAEQIAEFDKLADRLIEGEDLAAEYRPSPKAAGVKVGARGWAAGRMTNDTLESLSAIYKAVRGRSGFSAEGGGAMDRIRGDMTRYRQRIEMLKSANAQESKTKKVPTSYAMENKKIDQGRASDYWTTEHEMAARAFSSYVEDKVAERGGQSDFLAFGANNDQPIYRMFHVRPFPEGQERIDINEAFDRLVGELETKETDKGTALYSRAFDRGDAPEGIHLEDLRALSKAIKMAYPIHPTGSINEWPADLRKLVQEAPHNEGIDAAFYAGEIWLAGDRIPDLETAQNRILHEGLHGGLRGIFGDALKPQLVMIHLTNPDVRARVAEMRAQMPGLPIVEATEEVLVSMGAAGEATNLKGWDKFVAWVRDWLRAHGFAKSFVDAYTDNDVLHLLQTAAQVAEGKRSGQSRYGGYSAFSTRYSRAVAPKWSEGLPQAQQDALKKAGVITEEKTLAERARELRADFGKKFTQGLFDQFAPIKELDYKAYMLARMSRGSDGGLEAMMMYGRPYLDGGALNVGMEGGLMQVFQNLQGEHDRFLAWIAGNRAEQLKAAGKENLFTDDDISALKDLNTGPMPDGAPRDIAYADAHQKFNAYMNAVLDIAEETGLIDGESREVWAKDFYVPFYRAMEDGAGPTIKSGLVNQYAFKKLKGGQEELRDLMANTLMNWSHLLSASMKNQAADATLKAAEAIGVANPIPAQQKGAVSVIRAGEKAWYEIADPFLLDAVTAMEWTGFKGPAMEALGKFKRALTTGVTVNPTFKIRNLIRDTASSVAQANLSYNVAKNLAQGWRLTAHNNPVRASMMASGGLMRFGTMLEGNTAVHAKRLIEAGVDANTILDKPHKVLAMLQKGWDAYQELGDRGEQVNRAALYQQLRDKGLSHLEASFQARDLLDFSMQGKWTAVRFLTQVVPFMNARLQGMYKLGRAAKNDPARMAYVIGGLSLASIALLLAYHDDDDWKKREDWDRDQYWWFKVGGLAYRIPKPFEVGAVASVAERSMEYLTSTERDPGQRFLKSMGNLIGNNLSMNPVPQLVKPLIDLYANKDSFTGRPIETQGMENLSKDERIGRGTTIPAQILGKLDPTDTFSPVQVDFLARAYFGWLGTTALTALDFGLRPIAGHDKAAMELRQFPVIGNFIEGLPTEQSRYVTLFYDEAKKIDEAYADYRNAIRMGDQGKAAGILQNRGELIRQEAATAGIKRTLGALNQQERKIELNPDLSAGAKRVVLDAIAAKKDELARQIGR